MTVLLILVALEVVKSLVSRLFIQPCIQVQIKESIKALCYWPLCGEFTGDRWIPHTNGQWHGKCFRFMTSSCFGQAVTALLSWPFSWSGCFHKVWPVICFRRVLFHRQFCYCNWNPMRIWFALTVFLGSISLQYFAHAMTVEMLCHVQNFVMITALGFGWGTWKFHWIMVENCLWHEHLLLSEVS